MHRRAGALSKRRHPIESPLPDKAFDFCFGPDVIAVQQTRPFDKRWVTWVATAGMRWAIHTPGFQLSDTSGVANTLFTSGERPAHVSMAFDQDNQPALAIPLNPTTIRLRKRVAGIVTTFDFTGESPILFYTGQIVWPTANSDIVCLYIRPPYDKIYGRVQRDNYGIEYVINGSLPSGTSIKRLIKADSFKENGFTRQYLYGLNPEGIPLEWRSKIYPPFPVFAEDKALINLGFKDGALLAVIVQSDQGFEKGSVTAAFKDGNYSPITVEKNLGFEKLNLSLAVKDGIYSVIVVGSNQGNEKANITSAFKDGNYANIVVSAGSFTEKANCTLAFKDGVYAP